MSDLISKALLCGLGLASLTKDAIEKTAEDLVNQSKISEEEGRKLVKDLQRRSVQAEKALEEKVEAAVHKALKKLGLAPAGRPPKARKMGRAKAARRAHAAH